MRRTRPARFRLRERQGEMDRGADPEYRRAFEDGVRVFANWTHKTPRVARLSVYFTPPNDWVPPHK